jgi:hypothetical protein
MKIYKNAWFIRFARTQNISADALREAVWRAESGQIDADLGGGLIQATSCPNGPGKVQGIPDYHAVPCWRKSVFVYGFSKSERENIREDEEANSKRWPDMSWGYRISS